MLSRFVSLLLALCLDLSLTLPVAAEDGTATCVFDGFAIDYPAELKLAEDDLGLFFVGDGGFIQINTQAFPKKFSMSVTDLFSSGAVETLKQDSPEGFVYVSEGEIQSINGREYIFLEARKESIPFYQYIAMIDSTLFVFTVKGEACGRMMPQVLPTLRKAEAAEEEHRQYTGDPIISRITRPGPQGQEEPAGFDVPPYPVQWADFEKGFWDTMLRLTGETDPSEFPVGRCCFTDGRWARVMIDGAVVVRFYTDGPEDTDMLTGFFFTPNMSWLSEEQVFVASSTLLLSCAMGLGVAHSETVNRFAGLIETGFPEEAAKPLTGPTMGLISILAGIRRENSSPAESGAGNPGRRPSPYRTSCPTNCRSSAGRTLRRTS